MNRQYNRQAEQDKKQTMVDQNLHNKLKIKKHEPGTTEGYRFLLP